ncbi:MAG: hypothetical protein ABW170_21815 [Candidatus Thiodiazotropha sp. L084R]
MRLTAFLILALVAANIYANPPSLSATITDPIWNGRQIPSGQQCNKFGGTGATPPLSISQIPAGANAIVMEYSDRTYQPMDHGGHGKIGFRIQSGTSTVAIPSVKGHTFDLPEDFFLIEAQKAPSWDKEGAYLPPCSGGKGNEYYVTIKAVSESNGGIRKILSEVELPLGQY